MSQTNRQDRISRIQMATRDTAMAFSAFRKADERLAAAVRDAREHGISEQEIDQAVAKAAQGNPRVRDAVMAYADALQAGRLKHG